MTTEDMDEEELAEVRKRVQRVLGDFEVTPEGASETSAAASITVAVTRQELPVPQLVRLVLTWGLGAKGYGKEEKRAWLVPFAFDQSPCSIGLYKFGLRLQVQTADEDEARTLATRIVGAIDKAIRVVAVEGGVLLTYAERQVRAGNLTVQNQYHMFNSMYRDFRSQVESEQPTDADSAAADQPPSLESVVAQMNSRIEADGKRFHASIAMVNAFFSLLEHSLVLIWPLTGVYKPGVDDAEEMIKSGWSDKFKTVFDIGADADAKRVYDGLREVAEEYRNTFDHGGFDKRRGSFFVHFPGGAIPASLSASRRRIRTNFFPVAEPEVGDILRILDATEEWLRSGAASLAMMFIEGGLDVPFDSATLNEVRSQMTSEEHFEDYLRGLSRYLDDQTNMDW